MAVAALLTGCGGSGESAAEANPAPAPPPQSSPYSVATAAAQLPAPGVRLPASPLPTSTHTVRNAAELAAALVNGSRRIVCVPGSLFDQPVSVRVSDIVLDMAGCTIDDSVGARILTVGADRVQVNGGSWNGGFAIGAHSDIHINHASFTGVNPAGSLNEVMHAHRVLIERSSLVQRSNNVVLWSQQATDLVIANSRVVQETAGLQATIRTHGAKVVVMDSYVANPTHHTLRAHADGAMASPYVVWTRNVLVGGRIQAWGGDGDPLQVTQLWVTGNTAHWNATGFHVSHPSVTTAVLSGNRVYDSTGAFTWPTGPGWTVENNHAGPYAAPAPWNHAP